MDNFSVILEFEKFCETWWSSKCLLEDYMMGSVYHYTSAISLESILKNKKFWVTKFDFLNDFTEYKYGINIIKQVFSKNIHSYKYLNESSIKKILKFIYAYIDNSFILSTTTNGDSTNLWSNYSKFDGYNMGLCLDEIVNRELNNQIYVTGNNILENGEPEKYYLLRNKITSVCCEPLEVIYNPVKQAETISNILLFIDNLKEKYYSIIYDDDDVDEKLCSMMKSVYYEAKGTAVTTLMRQVLSFKNELFKQDEEYRLVFILKKKIDVIKYRILKGVFIPYIEVGFDEPENNKALPINSITIGPKNNLDIAEKGLKYFMSSLQYKVTRNEADLKKGKISLRKSNVPLRY